VPVATMQLRPDPLAIPGVPHGDLLFALLVASALGAAIGLERELSGKPAGFRTNLLICLGSTLLTHISTLVGEVGGLGADPGRISAQIVSGVGFLGAGTIIQARGSVTGLTTAATLWVVAAIGIAVGTGAYVEAVGTTALVLLALWVLGKVEGRLVRAKRERTLTLELDPTAETVQLVEAVLDGEGLQHRLVELDKRGEEYIAQFELMGPPARRGAAVRTLFGADYVRRVTTE